MAIFRQHIAPFLIVLVFLIALVAAGARSFLPSDMAAPAPIEEVSPQKQAASPKSEGATALPPALSVLVKGLPDEPALSAQLSLRVK